MDTSESRFIQYINVPGVHDGTIVAVQAHDTVLRVSIDPAPEWLQQRITLTFRGVERVSEHHPVGMLLYGLTEWTDYPPRRRFVFANWYDETDQERDDAGMRLADCTLEVLATELDIER